MLKTLLLLNRDSEVFEKKKILKIRKVKLNNTFGKTKI